MIKKTLTALTAAAVILGCFTSCSDTSGSSAQESASSEVSEASVTDTNSADSPSDSTEQSKQDDSSSDSSSDSSYENSALLENDMFTERDLSGEYSDCIDITLSGTTASCADSSVSISGSTVTITAKGTYRLSGTLSDGQIVVNAPDTDKVQLVLDNAEITKKSGAALYVIQADKVFVTTVNGSTNTLASTGEFVSTDDNNVDGAVFAKSDIAFNGAGTLNISCETKHGVVTKDDLKIGGGTYNITSASQGLSGKDSVRIAAGTLNINSGTDAIHSENADDAAKGFIYIAGGTLELTSGRDCIDASSTLTVAGGTFNLVSGGGSSSAQTYGGTYSESYKGMKSAGVLTITEGTFTIDSLDDAIHSNTDVKIEGGKFEISTGDDGVHADNETAISGGEMNISKCYEGIEGMTVNISGGKITLASSDDGINVAGGNDGGMGGGFGHDMFASGGDSKLTVSGGEITMTVNGDGLDANGSLEVSGGTVYIYGPTGSGNGSLDYDQGGIIMGGTVIAAGSSGMAMNFGQDSTQGSILVSAGNSSAGTEVKLTDSSGNIIARFTPAVSFQSLLISTPDITSDGTYTLSIGDSTQEITMSGYIYGNGTGGFGGGRPGGDMGGMRPDKRDPAEFF